MEPELERTTKKTILVPPEFYLEIPQFPLDVPVYVATSELLKEAFKYIITDNPLGKYDPNRDVDVRLERMLALGGFKKDNLTVIDTILFPLMVNQTPLTVGFDQGDYGQLEKELEKEGRANIGTAHNHNDKVYGWRLEVTTSDEKYHRSSERMYKGPQLTVIISEDDHFAFWRPSAYEIFIDGQQLPYLPAGVLKLGTKVYQLT